MGFWKWIWEGTQNINLDFWKGFLILIFGAIIASFCLSFGIFLFRNWFIGLGGFAFGLLVMLYGSYKGDNP
jgi:hypothetical protein